MANLNTRIRGVQILDKGVDTAQIADSAVEALQINADAVTTVKILDANVTMAKIESGSDKQLVIVGAGGVPAYQDVTGDVTIGNTGVTAIGATKVVDSMINDDVATGLAGTGLTATNGVLDVDAIVTNIVEGDIQKATFEGDDATVEFDVGELALANSIQVYLNGLLQESGSGKDYTVTTDKVTFSVAPLTGDFITIHSIKDD